MHFYYLNKHNFWMLLSITRRIVADIHSYTTHRPLSSPPQALPSPPAFAILMERPAWAYNGSVVHTIKCEYEWIN